MAGPTNVRGPQEMLMKWWSKHGVERGRVTRHLSPYEQMPVKSFIQGMPFKTLRKVKENGLVIVPMLLLFFGTMEWAVRANANEHKKHWD